MKSEAEFERQCRIEVENRFIKHLLDTTGVPVDVNIPVFTQEEFELLWQEKYHDL